MDIRTIALPLLFSAGLTISATQVNANLIQNGNFDTPDVTGSFVTFNSSPAGFGWTIVSDDTPDGSATTGFLGVDVINTLWAGSGGTTNPDGFDQSLDIDRLSSISQSFPTDIGQTYFIEFDYSHNRFASSASGMVKVDGASSLISSDLFHNTPNNASNMQWDTYLNSFVADSATTTLTLSGDLDNGKFGFVVDNVSVTTVPIAPALWLFGSGLLGLVGFARRKHSA